MFLFVTLFYPFHRDDNSPQTFSLYRFQKNMCCFETGKYSCKDDVKKMCAAYAGCEALVEGVPLGAAEEDEE